MTSRKTGPGRLLLVSAGLAAPALVVLALLALFGLLAPLVALLAAAAVVAGTALILRRYFAGLRAARAYTEALEPGTEPPRPAAKALVVAEILVAVRRLHARLGAAIAEAAERARALEAVLDTLPDPVVTVDAEGRLVTANAAARALFGQEIIGLDLGAALRNPSLRAAALAALAGQPAAAARGVEFSIPVPVERSFRARIVTLTEPAAGAALVIALQDMTDMARTDQMRADFIANVSHELRTPLASLIGYIETLQGAAQEDSGARRQFLSIMARQSQRMSRLVDDLLSLSAIELNEHTPPASPVDLLPLLRAAADTLAPRARARDIDIVLEPTEDLPDPARVPGDADQLAEVFENLIDNAVKYTRSKTRVRITVAPGPSRAGVPVLCVSVSDAGDGIPPQHLPRLTERFYRVDPARSRELGGTGLGLAIVKHIVNRHRGRLSIESTPGTGTTVTVELSAVAPSEDLGPALD